LALTVKPVKRLVPEVDLAVHGRIAQEVFRNRTDVIIHEDDLLAVPICGQVNVSACSLSVQEQFNNVPKQFQNQA
jgi:hypothetical protein